MGFSDVDANNKPISFQETFEVKRTNHLQELQQKEDEMRQMFVVRVKEKEAELKEAEKEVQNPVNCVNLYIKNQNVSVTRQVRQAEERPHGGKEENRGL